jgi:hypothetical protein
MSGPAGNADDLASSDGWSQSGMYADSGQVAASRTKARIDELRPAMQVVEVESVRVASPDLTAVSALCRARMEWLRQRLVEVSCPHE